MIRENGRYWMKFTGADGKKQELEIVRTIGSRRIQQYLTKSGDQWVRLPIAYDLVQHRWMHLNGSFFYPDGTDYKQHVAEWNLNCVFCHNVKAQPNLDWTSQSRNTEVAELGIACGACHGPAGEHAQRALSPVTRYLWHVKDPGAPPVAVTNPAKLDSDRSAMVCGHCHGQRLPEPRERIRTMMSDGDPYDPGKNLLEFYKTGAARGQDRGLQFCVPLLGRRLSPSYRIRVSRDDALDSAFALASRANASPAFHATKCMAEIRGVS